MYFFFNEGNQEQSRTATVAGRGQAQVWDLSGGQIHSMTGATAENDSVRFPLLLEPYETKVVVVGPLPSEAMSPEPALVSGTTLEELGGDWTLDLNGKHLTTPLKSWEELGTQSFAGPAIYHKQFTAPTVPAGKHVYLEIADARDYVRIRVNGAATVDPKAWQPYRWDITTYLQPGNNDLQINVFATLSGRGGVPSGPGGPPPASGLLGPVRLVAR